MMRKLLVIALLLPFNVWAANWYIDATNGNDSWNATSATYVSGSTGPKKTLNAIPWASIAGGDTVHLTGTFRQDGTATNRLTVGSITGNDASHRVVIDGGDTTIIYGSIPFNNTSKYTGATGNATLATGTGSDGYEWQRPNSGSYPNIWRKKIDIAFSTSQAFELYINDVRQTPSVNHYSDTEANILSALSATGIYAVKDNGSNTSYVYVNTGSSSQPTDGTITIADITATNALAHTNSKSYVTFKNFTIKNRVTRSTYSVGTVYITGSTGTLVDHLSFYDTVVSIYAATSPSTTISNNLSDHASSTTLFLNSTNNDLIITGNTFINSGGQYYPNKTAILYSDSDGIGIGQAGGVQSNLTVTNNILYGNYGNGICICTSNNWEITGTSLIAGNKIYNNGYHGISVGGSTGVGASSPAGVTGTIYIIGNLLYSSNNYSATMNAINTPNGASTNTRTFYIEKNTFYDNYFSQTMNIQPMATSSYYIRNNLFYQNKKPSGTFWGEIYTNSLPSNYTEDYNWFTASSSNNTSRWIYVDGTHSYYYNGGTALADYRTFTSQGAHDVLGAAPDINWATFQANTAYSNVIDAGVAGGATRDYAGNPIWGVPDLGGYEYQPTGVIGTDALAAPSSRIYQGDQEGRFRALASSTGTCPLQITPSGGTWNDLSSTDVRPEFGDVTSLSCPSKQKVSFTFTPASSMSNPVFRYRGARGQTYQVKVGGSLAGSSIVGCQKSNCLADKNGDFSFSWNGSLATAKTFEIVTGGTFQRNISHRIDMHPNE